MSQYKATCPSCHSENVDGVSRVVGYFSFIGNWNAGKVAELMKRKKGAYNVEDRDPQKPFSLDLGEDRVYLFGTEHCEKCADEESVLKVALKGAGLEGKVGYEVVKLTDKKGERIPYNVAKAVKASVPLNNLPAIVAVRDRRVGFMAATAYENGDSSFMSLDALSEGLKGTYASNP